MPRASLARFYRTISADHVAKMLEHALAKDLGLLPLVLEAFSAESPNLLPRAARALLSLILVAIHINWEDIPDPGAISARRN
jgi:hypothetical protein